MINTPKVILADEPTGNLNNKSGLEVFELLSRIRQDSGVTVVLVTHNEALERGADRILQLRDGKLLE